MDTESSTLQHFWELLKPRVMSLSIFTSACAVYLSHANIHWVMSFSIVFFVALGAGAAGCLNMYFDREIDGLMSRTNLRPLPSKRISPSDALGFGIILSLFSTIGLGLFISFLGGILLAFTIFFYAVFYTLFLKKRSPQNIVIGGIAGALPPVVAWVSTGTDLSWLPLYMFFIIFLWTPPHFWALSLLKVEDYKKANIPMMPVVKGEKATRYHIFVYTLLLVVFSVMPVFYIGRNFYAFALIGLLGAWFGFSSFQLLQKKYHSMKVFKHSIFYLFFFFLVLTAFF